MKARFINIIAILAVSSTIGLLVNFLSGKGMPAIKSDVISFVSDSIIFSPKDSLANDEIIILKNDSLSFDEKKKAKTNHSENEKIIEQDRKDNSAISKDDIIEFEEPQNITIETAIKLFNSGRLFIDARENEDFLAGHIKNSINIPYYDFDTYKYLLDNISKSSAIITYCSGTDCDLSIMLANKLFKLGYKKVFIFFGGWNDWQTAGYPVENSESE